jgi:hypothetical protein
MQEPLRESKYENAVDVTSFCTEILAGDQSSSFEGLGKNSLIPFVRPGLFAGFRKAGEGGYKMIDKWPRYL